MSAFAGYEVSPGRISISKMDTARVDAEQTCMRNDGIAY